MTETYSLQQLDKINIVSEDGKMTFGPDQEWYPEERARITSIRKKKMTKNKLDSH